MKGVKEVKNRLIGAFQAFAGCLYSVILLFSTNFQLTRASLHHQFAKHYSYCKPIATSRSQQAKSRLSSPVGSIIGFDKRPIIASLAPALCAQHSYLRPFFFPFFFSFFPFLVFLLPFWGLVFTCFFFGLTCFFSDLTCFFFGLTCFALSE